MNHYCLNSQIFIDKFSVVGIVSSDTAHFSRSEHYQVRQLIQEELPNVNMSTQIQFLRSPRDEVGVAMKLMSSYKRGTQHASMTGDVNACSLVFHPSSLYRV
jgi:hypothetical protein